MEGKYCSSSLQSWSCGITVHSWKQIPVTQWDSFPKVPWRSYFHNLGRKMCKSIFIRQWDLISWRPCLLTTFLVPDRAFLSITWLLYNTAKIWTTKVVCARLSPGNNGNYWLENFVGNLSRKMSLGCKQDFLGSNHAVSGPLDWPDLFSRQSIGIFQCLL